LSLGLVRREFPGTTYAVTAAGADGRPCGAACRGAMPRLRVDCGHRGPRGRPEASFCAGGTAASPTAQGWAPERLPTAGSRWAGRTPTCDPPCSPRRADAPTQRRRRWGRRSKCASARAGSRRFLAWSPAHRCSRVGEPRRMPRAGDQGTAGSTTLGAVAAAPPPLAEPIPPPSRRRRAIRNCDLAYDVDPPRQDSFISACSWTASRARTRLYAQSSDMQRRS
jgi:hypothetical protein